MEKFLSSIQNARYSIVCITHEAEIEMEDGRKKLCPVSGTTNFSRNTARYFDDVVYCEVKNKKHVVASSTTYATQILTGSRSDIALETETSPSLLSLFNSGLQHLPTQGEVALTALQKLQLAKGVGK
jgi:hypothetical protein